ncbi:MAG: asparagine synthase (glutamine-hydrolyzing) [Pyrinomonas sp.]|uniref:asparagine synthase (glutamine-hydrolyzing) n=1 Tax=Pyrinomonas sp. TaxID=2080306 RepID=UPI003324EF6F
MCGICGVWEYSSATGAKVEAATLERMRDAMSHRGPDASGLILLDDGRLGLGHRRLSIIDPSAAGHQPMRGCDHRNIWISFNGEIYNHAELRATLEAHGHRYRSRTDTETILHLYEEHGTEFARMIEGDFAIALWDGERERLVLARDPLGVKPLYFHQRDGRLIFASEIKAILAHPKVSTEMDDEALGEYLTFLAVPAPRTLFAGISKLPAGHMLLCTRDGSLKIERYWDALPPNAPPKLTEEEHAAEILRLLRASIKKRMMSDVPFGVFLSGGVDSSANVALMAEEMTQPVRTFTVGFCDDDALNELAQARHVAQLFATDHHEILIGYKEMTEFLPRLVFHQDEPIADPVCVPLYYVAQLARASGTAVVQVGEGSDEIFCGYTNYRRHLRIHERFWRRAERLPRAIKRAISTLALPALEATGVNPLGAEIIRRFGAGDPLFWGGAVVFDERSKARLLKNHPSSEGGTRRTVLAHLTRIAEERPQSDFLARLTYLELKVRLPELLLMRVDKITMATSVEARVPFLDQHLVEHALSVPQNLKIVGENGKWILKRALEKVLPAEILWQRKRGFGAPVSTWLRDDATELLDQHLLGSSLRRRRLFDYSFIARLIDEHRRGARDWGFHLWCLLNFSLWYERWIEPS